MKVGPEEPVLRPGGPLEVKLLLINSESLPQTLEKAGLYGPCCLLL